MENQELVLDTADVKDPSENKSEEQKMSEQPPEVQAAMFLQGALPAFRNNLEKLTGVQAKRVLSALIESPLENTTPDFTTKEAHELFLLGMHISNAKFILFNVALKDKELTDSIEEKAKEAGASEGNVENKGEEVND